MFILCLGELHNGLPIAPKHSKPPYPNPLKAMPEENGLLGPSPDASLARPKQEFGFVIIP